MYGGNSPYVAVQVWMSGRNPGGRQGWARGATEEHPDAPIAAATRGVRTTARAVLDIIPVLLGSRVRAGRRGRGLIPHVRGRRRRRGGSLVGRGGHRLVVRRRRIR